MTMSATTHTPEQIAEILADNQRLRDLLQEVRGCGGQGTQQHETFPGCGHVQLQPDCLHCAKEDARRCAYWELAAKRERDQWRDFAWNHGLFWEDFEAWLADDGPEKVRQAQIEDAGVPNGDGDTPVPDHVTIDDDAVAVEVTSATASRAVVAIRIVSRPHWASPNDPSSWLVVSVAQGDDQIDAELPPEDAAWLVGGAEGLLERLDEGDALEWRRRLGERASSPGHDEATLLDPSSPKPPSRK